MGIIYTDCAEETLLERGISKENVKKTIYQPYSIVGGRKGRKIAQKIGEKKLLRVIYEAETNDYIIITAYYTSTRMYLNNENNR